MTAKEKFVEIFVRRFAEDANLSRTYNVEFYDIYEVPPKVSVKVSTNTSSFSPKKKIPRWVTGE